MIEVKLSGSKSVSLKTKRELLAFDVDVQNEGSETITVSYRDVKYYTAGSDTVIVETGHVKSYQADYKAWIKSDAGKAIKAAILAKLAKI